MSRRKVLPALVFCCALILSGGLAFFVHHHEALRQAQKAELVFSDAVQQLDKLLHSAITSLAATSALLSGRDTAFVPREDFLKYVQHLQRLHLLDGLDGIGLIEHLPPQRHPQAQAQLAKDYALPPPQDGGARTIAPILLYEPLQSRSAPQIGTDILPLQGALLDQALASGAVVISPPLPPPLATPDAATRNWLYLSVPNAAPLAPERLVFMQISFSDLIADLGITADPPLALRLQDGEQVLYSSSAFPQQDSAQKGLLTQSLTIGGRDWQIEGYLPQPFWGTFTATKITALLGLLSAMALAVITRHLLLKQRSQQAVIEGQAAQLKAQDMHLREMSHRLKNVLTRVIAIARQTARSTTEKADFLTTFDQRLRAMAKAQDMLTLSPRETVDLHKLIEAEVGQIYGEAVKELQMSGDKVELGPDQIQSLGLAIHELATNALKYGAPSQPEGSLHLEWQRLETPTGPMLRLDWRETFTPPPDTPAPRAGFGTRLIDSCINVDLGGQITRNFHDKGLDITILLPLHQQQCHSKPQAKRRPRASKSARRS